jgi:hypothetical protein
MLSETSRTRKGKRGMACPLTRGSRSCPSGCGIVITKAGKGVGVDNGGWMTGTQTRLGGRNDLWLHSTVGSLWFTKA